VGAKELIERLAVALLLRRSLRLGKTLHPEQRALAAQDRKDRHQQHPPLREAHTTAHAAIRQRFEEADQISRCSRALERRRGQGSGAVRLQEIPVREGAQCRLGRTFNRPCPHPLDPLRPPQVVMLAAYRQLNRERLSVTATLDRSDISALCFDNTAAPAAVPCRPDGALRMAA
jgi:hypothetical protein